MRKGKLIDPIIEMFEALGIQVLDVIQLEDREEIYVIAYDDLDRLVNHWIDHPSTPATLHPIYYNLIIAQTPTGGYVDMTPPECYVQESQTFIGILHDCWCEDVDWWDASVSIGYVDDYVMENRIPDTLENYQYVMKKMDEEMFRWRRSSLRRITTSRATRSMPQAPTTGNGRRGLRIRSWRRRPGTRPRSSQ